MLYNKGWHDLCTNFRLTGQKLGRVFNTRSGCVCDMHLCCYEVKLPNLELKTWPKQLLGYLLLDFASPTSDIV
jgi:hypothetical protein